MIFLNLFAWLEGVSTASQAYAELQRISQHNVDVRARLSAVALYDVHFQINTDNSLQLRPEAKQRIMQVISESPIRLLVLFGAEAPVGQLNIASPESGVSTLSAPTTPKTPRDGLLGSKRSSQSPAEGTPKRTKIDPNDLQDSSKREDDSFLQSNLSSVDAASGPNAQYDPAPTNTHSFSPDKTLDEAMEALADTETNIAETSKKETTIPHDSQELHALTLKTNTPELAAEESQERNSRFGKLTTVDGSLWNSTFYLRERLTTFGRDPSCTYVP